MPLFEKGQSGNPGGRPKGPSLKAEIVRQLGKKAPDGRRNVDAIAAALIEQAREGKIEAIREILDRVDGKVPTPPTPIPDGGAALAVTSMMLILPPGVPIPDGYSLGTGSDDGAAIDATAQLVDGDER